MNESPESELLLDRIDELRVSIETLQDRLAIERRQRQRALEAARAYRALFQATNFDGHDIAAADAAYTAALENEEEHA